MFNTAEILGTGIRETLLQYFEDPAWPRLSAKAFTVWCALLARAVPWVHLSSASYREIGALIGLARDTVAKGIAELTMRGYIIKLDLDGPRNTPPAYRLLRVADIKTVPGADYQKEKAFAATMNDVIDKAIAEKALKDTIRDVRNYKPDPSLLEKCAVKTGE
jgi:hypothetical protein